MKSAFYTILIFILLTGCNESLDMESDFTRILSLEDIKREYLIADSLNLLDDRSNLDFETKILGIDKRNGQVIIRTCLNRGFGCLLYSDFYTILYINCDSVCCETNGFWLVDYVGIAGQPSPVGCAPDTVQSTISTDCGCTSN